MNDPLGIGSLLPDVLQDVMSAQLLQRPLQVFFCSDEVWNIKKSGVILARMVIPQHPVSMFRRIKPKDRLVLKAVVCCLQVPYHLWKGGRCHLMECTVVPLLDRVAGCLLCTDGLPMLSMQRSGLWVLWHHVWSRISSGHFRSCAMARSPSIPLKYDFVCADILLTV